MALTERCSRPRYRAAAELRSLGNKMEIVMIGTKNGHDYKCVLILIALWLGCSNWALAVTYGELNAQREQAGLPLLTGNNRNDFQMLVRECNGGIRYSCALARQIQGPPQQQQRAPVYTPPESQIVPLPPLGEPAYTLRGYGGGGGSNKSEDEAYSHRQQQKSEMYGCIEGCLRKCSILGAVGGDVQECRREEDRCKANCR